MKIKIFFMYTLIFIASCNRAKEKAHEIIEETTEKVKDEISDLLVQNLEFHGITFTEYFDLKNKIEVNELGGIWCEMPYAFYYGFLKYEANSDSIMNYVSKIETRLPDISDTVFSRTDTVDVYLSMTSVKKEYDQKFSDEFAFFDEVKTLATFEVYKCSRYPNIHILIIDKETNTIYHHFQKYWD